MVDKYRTKCLLTRGTADLESGSNQYQRTKDLMPIDNIRMISWLDFIAVCTNDVYCRRQTGSFHASKENTGGECTWQYIDRKTPHSADKKDKRERRATAIQAVYQVLSDVETT